MQKARKPLTENIEDFKFSGNRPSIVDFYAEWCAPCNMVAPILEELSKEYEEKVDFYKINVDEENELSAKFDIRSIPTLFFIPVNGKAQRIQGAMSKQHLKETIEKVLLKN